MADTKQRTKSGADALALDSFKRDKGKPAKFEIPKIDDVVSAANKALEANQAARPPRLTCPGCGNPDCPAFVGGLWGKR